jgi:hypothetical protein
MARSQSLITDSLSQAHAALLDDLAKLEDATRAIVGDGLGLVCTRLSATRAHVLEHFQFEEKDGYMDKVRKREPRFERTIQELYNEHGRLAQSIDALVEEANAARELTDGFRQRIREWIECVRKHEARESRLVLDAFNSEVGAED